MTIHTRKAASNVKISNLGELELRVMEVLWQRPHLDARQVRDSLSGARVPSLSTIQSALERLFRKQYVDRVKHGQAYFYFSTVSRSALLGRMLGNVIQLLHDGKMETILSSFVHVAADLDDSSLDELEALIKVRRDANDA
ncbi:BlaI/MecI/CopY family transcriptional regulator [Pseudohongiella spirulinae]|uniref:Transcriptional regulator, TrmB n=1 Tax=Pseudohongiella spirulinae TaxID=1249552 RepID=A0A0S2KCK4_9GAMM|nr:BlaI/MecI/CopY family transcriptional regulator [Pseudohongiella spirulinae]ALO45711.1 Transcriptional regulator, TrmB [Pseudohongiella spirulinae]